MNILKRVYAKLAGKKLMWLVDFDSEMTLVPVIDTLFTSNNETLYLVERWWPSNIHKVLLKPDGSVVSADGSCCYVDKWYEAL